MAHAKGLKWIDCIGQVRGVGVGCHAKPRPASGCYFREERCHNEVTAPASMGPEPEPSLGRASQRNEPEQSIQQCSVDQTDSRASKTL